MTVYIKNFYLNSPLKRYEYLMVWLSNLPEDMIAHNKLKENGTTEGHVYVEVKNQCMGHPKQGYWHRNYLKRGLMKNDADKIHTWIVDS